MDKKIYLPEWNLNSGWSFSSKQALIPTTLFQKIIFFMIPVIFNADLY